MIIRFFESSNIANLYPLTLTRPAADLRCGILTIAEKWVMDLSASAFGFEFSDGTGESETENRLYLSGKFTGPEGKTTHYINGHILPYPSLVSSIQNLTSTGSLWQNDTLIACGSDAWEQNFPDKTQWTGELQTIDRPYHIFCLWKKAQK